MVEDAHDGGLWHGAIEAKNFFFEKREAKNLYELGSLSARKTAA
jgi:hypothetical protein